MTKTLKDHSVVATISTLVSLLVGTATLYTFTERVFAGEIKQEIASQLRPVIQTQEILLRSDIESRRMGIAAMEFKRDMCLGNDQCWTIRDAQDLTRARAELAAREQALFALQGDK